MSDDAVFMSWSLSVGEQMDNLRTDIRNLKAENTRLQEECKRMFQANVEKNKEIAGLLTDNANLRDDLDRMTEAVVALHSAPLEDQLLQALNENDKLREHLANVLPFAMCSDACFVGNCFMYQECKDDVTDTCHALIRMKELAHELGVDADYE